jgi:hypothetical protein
MTKPTKQELDRIIIGNQIIIMNSLAVIMKQMVGDMEKYTILEARAKNVGDWWEKAFDGEVRDIVGVP